MAEDADFVAWLAEHDAARRAMEADLSGDLYRQQLAAITGPVPEATLRAVEAQAARQAAQIVRETLRVSYKKMREIIREHLREKGSAGEALARKLRSSIGLNLQQMKQLEKLREQLVADGVPANEISARLAKWTEEKISERALTISRTEARYVTAQGNHETALQNGAKYKLWCTSGDARVADSCRAAGRQGPIPVDKAFSNGQQYPPGHPNCRCTLSYISGGKGGLQYKRMQQMARETDQKTQAAIEAEAKK